MSVKTRLVRLAAVIVVATLGVTALSAQYRIGGKMGRKEVNGRNLLVHITVAAPAGTPVESVADRALNRLGANPMQSAPFVTLGPVWPYFSDANTGNDFLVQHYNGTGSDSNPSMSDPTTGGGETAWDNSRATWSGVTTSRFAFAFASDPNDLFTDRCPSLVEECVVDPAIGQVPDENNDVAWCDLGNLSPIFGGIIGVTWFVWNPDNNQLIEADVCMNGNPTVGWSTNGGLDIDLETVVLHELGHVAALGHSRSRRAVMYRSYLEVRRDLHSDDINGISFLYPTDDGVEDPPGVCVGSGGLPLGDPCIADADCCSGKCKGKHGSKTCK